MNLSFCPDIYKIRKEHRFKLEDIEEVVMGTAKRMIREVGAIREPKDMTGFQFSANYTLAMALVKGSNQPKDVTEDNLKDPQIRLLAAKVRVELDEDLDAVYPKKIGGTVTIRLKDGTLYKETVMDCRGTPENPMSKEEIKDKFRGLVGTLLQERRVEQIIDVVDKLEKLDDISEINSLLVKEERR
ncbi:MAG: MmgE/PrpD family protein [Betaproteobacteria bacterium]|nr:MmgE/PrpD family protein [Betaproteobacteria bacterium]